MSTTNTKTTAVVASTTACACGLGKNDLEGLAAVGAGTFVGITGKMQGSANGTDFFDIPFFDIHGAFQDSGTTITLADSTAAFIARVANIQGYAAIQFKATAWVSGSAPVTVQTGVYTASPPAPLGPAGGNGAFGALTATSSIKSTSPSAGVGYATGAGSTVTQITTRATGVTINAICGKIQTDTTSLAAGAEAEFVVTNSAVAIGDVVVVSLRSGNTGVGTCFPFVSAVTAGTFNITISNLHASTAETGACVLNFAIVKAVTA